MGIKKYYVTVDDAGTAYWHKDTRCKGLHRDDGPAVEFANGHKEWYQNGQRHRTDGPAVEWWDGGKSWYINGKKLTETEFLAATQPVVELTVADVEKLVGKRVEIIK